MSVGGYPVSPAVPVRRSSLAVAVLAVVALLASMFSGLLAAPAGAAVRPGDLAAARPATASASQVTPAPNNTADDDCLGDGCQPAAAVDGDDATRWASGNGPDADVEHTAWLAVDLGAPSTVRHVEVLWEAAHAVRYTVDISADGQAWTTVSTQDRPTTSPSQGDRRDVITLAEPVQATHVRITALERRSAWSWAGETPHWFGYSVRSLEVFADVPAPAPEQPEEPEVPEGPANPVPDTGEGASEVLLDFDGDTLPQHLFAWGDGPANTPGLSLVADADRPGAEPGNSALRAQLAAHTSWGGFSYDLPAAQDWSDHGGFAFWFRGAGSGEELQFEVKFGGTSAGSAGMYEAFFVDDSTQWQRIAVPFSALELKGSGGAGEAPDTSVAWGFAVTLNDAPATYDYAFDDVALFEQVALLEDFEGDSPLTEAGPTGIYPWNYQGQNPELSVAEIAGGNHVLRGDYASVGGRGYNHIVDAAQDWSGFEGIRFLWDSAGASGNSPTAPPTFAIELKLGGVTADSSGLWTTTITPPSGGGLQQVVIPFSQLVWRADYQPPGAVPSDEPPLDHAWGYAVTLPVGVSGSFYADDVELYGSARTTTGVDVTATPVVAVDGGQTAEVVFTLTTPDGEALVDDVTVTYSTVGGTAEAGTHYTPVDGATLTFAAGTASGATQTVPVTTLAGTEAGGDVARTIEGTVEVEGAELAGAAPVVAINAYGMAYLDDSLSAEERAADLVARMDLAEKVGQMAQAERASIVGDPSQIADLALGSILSGGGSTPTPNTPEAWADMIDGFQRWTRATPHQIPLIYGVDAVHGHNNLPDATIFPHNIGLGAGRDPEIARQAAEATATEVRATGVPWTFAPCLCVTRDERWGRSYESFGEDPGLVSSMTTVVDGLQGTDADMSAPNEVLATIKHWVGDGATSYVPSAGNGYKIDQGVAEITEAELREIHIAPYIPAIERGAGSVMPSYSSVDFPDDDEGPIKMHGHDYLNNEVLRGELGFDGFTISDYNGIDQLPGSYADQVRESVNASVDMAMEPGDYAAFISTLTDEVEAERVTAERIDEAVTRILEAKFRLGLFEDPYADRTNIDTVGSAEHRAVAREAAAKSQVLLANDGLLPLAPEGSIYVAGSNADDVGNQAGGWTVSWQGMSGDILAGATSILDGITEVAPEAAVTFSEDASAPTAGHDVGIVVVGETPYAEGQGDVGVGGNDLELSAADRAAVENVCAAMECVVLVVSGRPQIVTDLVDDVDALVASWLPGSEGGGVADVLFGERPFTGRLPVSWPTAADAVPVNVGDEDYAPLYGFGWGLRTDSPQERLVSLLESMPVDHPAASAVAALALAPVWAEDGTPTGDPALAFDLLLTAAEDLTGTDDATRAMADTLVSLARDLAQVAMVGGDGVPADAVDIAADAEHELHAGNPDTAVVLLASILGLSPTALDVPGAPTDVVAVAGDGQVALSWTAPTDDGGSEILGYAVVPWVDGVAQAPVLSEGPATELVVPGLENGTTYRFTVAAVNLLGVGAESEPSDAVTPRGDGAPTDPPGEPTDPPGGEPSDPPGEPTDPPSGPGATPPGAPGAPGGPGGDLPATGATGGALLALLAAGLLGAGLLARRRATAR